MKLCDGLAGFNKSDRVLIKPNLVTWIFEVPFSPFGVVTTTAVMFALVKILSEEGINNISIGEGPIPIPKNISTLLYNTLGYEKLTKDYGVKWVDFNNDKFETVDLAGLKLSIARSALEADKIINVPVLKTHAQCKVSLGIKNLKGCINQKSKMACHNEWEILDWTFPRLVDRLPLALTMIDGVFALERGPLQSGTAYRKNILVASTDVLSADVVGASLLGYDADDVPHLKYFAENHSRSTGLADINVVGESLDKCRSRLEYDWGWAEDNTGPVVFKKCGVTDLALRKLDNTLCTGCSVQYNPMLIVLMNAFMGKTGNMVEVLTGKKQEAAAGYDKTILFGKCAIAKNTDNSNIKKAIPVKGCPPDIHELEKIMKQEGIDCDVNVYVKTRDHALKRYLGKEGFDMGLFLNLKNFCATIYKL